MNPTLRLTVEVVLPDGTRLAIMDAAQPIDARTLPIVNATAEDAWRYMLDVLREKLPVPPVHHGHD